MKDGGAGDLADFGVLPYLDKDLDVTTPCGQRVTRSTDGIGDSRLFDLAGRTEIARR